MQSGKFHRCCFFMTLVLLLTGPLFAQEEEEEEPATGERPTLRANTLSSDFKFDGMLNLAAWQAAADSIEDLIMIEPEEGDEPEGQTVVKVFANQSDIIVAAWCLDDDPNGIVSFSKARDSELEEEDHILIVFDTFQDGRSGYVFAVNPSGARFDGLVAERGEEVNSDWDAIWEAKTSQDSTGWYAEIRIPIKSINFKKGSTEWGFNIQRRVQRLQETSRWSGISLDYEIYQTSRAGLLTGLPPDLDYGLGLSVRPSLVSRAGKITGKDTSYDSDLSLDVTQRLGPNLSAQLTVNTDFAETEVDVRQINVTRFPLFFPEKRSFFLEGADIFEFGVGLDEDLLVPFHSRRIGLLGLDEGDQQEIPINVGGKINGRVGNTNLGALVVNTRKESLVLDTSEVEVKQATMGSFRVKQNVLEESSIGVLGTFGDQAGRSDSWMAGADFTFQTSSFMGEKNFLVSLWGLLNEREDLAGDKSAFGLRADYPNDLWAFTLTSVRVGDGFDPSLGFVPRNNIHLWNIGGEYKPRPQWSLVRQMLHELALTVYNKADNSDWESYNGLIKPVDWILESGDRVELSLEPWGDKPPEEFDISDDVLIPSGTYEWVRYIAGLRLAEKRIISGELLLETGSYYNGDLTTIEGRLAFKPSAFLTLEFTGERNDGKAKALPEDFEDLDPSEIELTEQKFTEELYGVRVLLNFSPNLQLSSFTQYDTQSRELGSNNKLRWTFHPLGDIFIVYNHNLIRNSEEKRWDFISNELPVKIQYTWRF